MGKAMDRTRKIYCYVILFSSIFLSMATIYAQVDCKDSLIDLPMLLSGILTFVFVFGLEVYNG